MLTAEAVLDTRYRATFCQFSLLRCRIRETPNGTSVADFLEKTLKGKSSNVPVNSRTGVNGPKKFGKKLFSSVTSKIQIPEKSLTTEEIKRQVELGISSLSFCRAVAEVLQERKRKFHQGMRLHHLHGLKIFSKTS